MQKTWLGFEEVILCLQKAGRRCQAQTEGEEPTTTPDTNTQ